ncbi:BTB domain-containing protein [Mycena venus]|uniref:BTB domain-containing protein n=1 Tax=Mycena venus TaxID=2733690 RepID=A0A8H6Z1F0_9AGAR|nr:BTB domain-containing protein [Mycena venus]
MAPDASEPQSTPTMASDPVPNVQRDKIHYHPTGDCIIRVQNTLFKIHKFHLVHNSTVFADMFNLPSGGQQEEGLSDDSPIILGSLSAADFRFVLKYMYAGAMSMQIDSIPLSALREIIAVAEFADKYEMMDLNKWALSYISRRVFVFVPPGDKGKVPLMSLPEPDLAALHGLYRRIDVEVGTEYQDLIMDAWISRIETNTLPITTALHAAEARRGALVAAFHWSTCSVFLLGTAPSLWHGITSEK